MKKITLNKYLALIVMFFCAIVFGYGQSIFTNTVTGANPGADDPYITNQIIDGNITVSGIGRGIGVNEQNTNDRYNARDWNLTVLDNNDYFEFIITPNATFEIDFTSFVYSGQSSPTGPINIAIRSSLDGFTNDIGIPSIAGTTIDLSSSTYQNIPNAITFRIYAWGGSSTNGTFSIDDFAFNGTVAAAPCLTTVTWNGANWSAAPDLTTIAEINADYDTANGGNEISFSACRLIVNNGFTLSIDDGNYVEIQNDIIVNTGGAILVRPQGAVVQIDDSETVTVDGTITVEKETAPLRAWYEYTYWSSPVESETIGSALSDSDTDRRFWFDASMFEDSFYENANDNTLVAGAGVDDIDDDNNDWQYANAATVMTPGVGYAATHSEAAYIIPPGPPTVPQFKYTFDGPFNTGIITVPVVRNDGSALDNNWNFIGNPYPSAIDINSFFTQNIYDAGTNTAGTLEGAIYFWSQNTAPEPDANGNQNLNFATSDYATHNGVGGTIGGDGVIPNGFIPSGQGFFVSFSQARPANTGTVVFNNAMRVRGATDNSQFFRTAGKQSKNKNNANKLWVNLTSDNGVLNQTLIGYVSGATNNNDGMYYDAPRNLSTGAAAILYTNIEDSNKKFAIQGKAENSLNEDEVINLGFKTTIDVATIYTLSIAQLEGDFLNNNAIYLKDNLLNKLLDLKISDYNFTSEVGEFNERFEIVFNSAALSVDEHIIKNNSLTIIEQQNGDVQFKLSGNLAMASIQIIDLQGRTIYSLNANGNSKTYNLSNLSQAPYIAKVALTDGYVITKKAVKRY